jgi:hypothetical protein
MSKETIMLSLEVSPEFYKLLAKLSEDSHSSQGDVLKKSIVLMNVALNETKKGHHVGIIGKDDKIITKITGI